MKYFFGAIKSWAYWRNALFSKQGLTAVFSIFGALYLSVEVLDFFSIYERARYGSYAAIFFLLLAIGISLVFRRPITATTITFPNKDFCVEVRIGNLFDASGAVMISSNTIFECDVAGRKIAVDSLQGQFTARYFPGNQVELIEQVETVTSSLGDAPYPIGTVVPINTHGKTFYLLAMSVLNEHGNAETTVGKVKEALNGLWTYVREEGELQELAVPLVGTGRGRLQLPRRKMIELIAESFVEASRLGKITDRLVICLGPDDALKSSVNLWEVKDHLRNSIVV